MLKVRSNLWWEGRTILSPDSKLLYREVGLSRKTVRTAHMYIYIFLLRMTFQDIGGRSE
jgi:hypothetical protein